MTRQLPLPVGLRDGNTLDSFLPAANPEAHAAVEALVRGEQPLVMLWGAPGTGRSHLLEAAADAVTRAGEPVFYVAFGAPGDLVPDWLAAAGESAGLVCLDDVDVIAGDRAWEVAVFHLFNEVRARGGRLLVAGRAPPAALGLSLPDLASRLALGLVVGLRGLDDAQREAILVFRASRRGLDMPLDVARYLLQRTSRQPGDLVGLLALLDQSALAHKRRLTVPFVRQVLTGAGPGGDA